MLLAVDTSTAQVGLALYDSAHVLAECAWRSSQRHTVELAPAVADLLTRCGATMDNVQALGVALGPGSFTSLRVGLSLVKGLALARHLPLAGVPTLDILAHAQPLGRHPLLCAIQAGRGRFALGVYKTSRKRWQVQGPARVVSLEALMAEAQSPAVVCGEFSAEEIQKMKEAGIRLVSPAASVRRPAVLAELAWARWQAGEVDDAASLAPIYLHTEGTLPV
ncbi:MAG: tRNA (adenosine(37)-N6)-threonylcarbamoyltransferase complex dimerization subunit type 1 TsaB [Chloroflexota bacterium]|nr:tRNA (adenosine(37)-N6)-threonylcarbamoyltransferase complex dimerization subunit type 1 TsaB [Chloroflexota bacterium]MBI5703148.1 tRNA (adenosine(37)-N6)-threonylcarbamoyltransferase complex dimerization subunit type 1 TsaB [Chloroflexota bacterium]